ncbi:MULTISPECIES: hypothetical protein [Priestia]|uniref:hypothetical protein n=1 Tax=Priestia TaxID=2800373 RepID=UPI00112CB84D|nr:MULTISPECIES: hypothetical protein [Priestia]
MLNKENFYDVVISIKPEYVHHIKNGTKTYEFRKSIFKRNVRYVYIYETLPVKKIIGFFPFEGYLSGTPLKIWNDCYRNGGISEDKFFKYFSKSFNAYAIIINNLIIFDNPIDPKLVISNFTAPQSYLYVPQGCLE